MAHCMALSLLLYVIILHLAPCYAILEWWTFQKWWVTFFYRCIIFSFSLSSSVSIVVLYQKSEYHICHHVKWLSKVPGAACSDVLNDTLFLFPNIDVVTKKIKSWCKDFVIKFMSKALFFSGLRLFDMRISD